MRGTFEPAAQPRANANRCKQPVQPLTIIDFDCDSLTYCTDAQLLYIVAQTIVSAKSLLLSDAEVSLFWRVRAELVTREEKRAVASC
jgi:hypothetical protein